MSTQVSKIENPVVGLRQAKRLLEEKNILKAFVAKDADGHIIEPFVKKLKKAEIEIEYVPTKKELGKMCRIDVDAAVAVIAKE